MPVLKERGAEGGLGHGQSNRPSKVSLEPWPARRKKSPCEAQKEPRAGPRKAEKEPRPADEVKTEPSAAGGKRAFPAPPRSLENSRKVKPSQDKVKTDPLSPRSCRSPTRSKKHFAGRHGCFLTVFGLLLHLLAWAGGVGAKTRFRQSVANSGTVS